MLSERIKGGLKDKTVRKILPRYVDVAENKIPANFQIAKRIVFDFGKSLSTSKLWEEHGKLMKSFYETKAAIDKNKLKLEDLEIPRFSLIDLKILLAKELMKKCGLCERKCEVNRVEGEIGNCKVNESFPISSEFVHMGEENHIRPSHTIFFMGCNFHCRFCQNFTISQWYERGVASNVEGLAKSIEEKRNQGSRNVNFVGGEPTVHLLRILEILKDCKSNVPVVWNSNMYMSEKTMEVLDGTVDMYLSDFKYGNDECAARLSNVKNFFEVCSRNHLLAAKQAEITLRHLILPNHFECCTEPVLKWVGRKIKGKCIVNIMDQFRPEFKAREYPEINRKIEMEEFQRAINLAKKLKINFIS